MQKQNLINDRIIQEVSSYISGSIEAELPPEVVSKTKHHILDTLAAMVSGSTLKAGRLAMKFVEDQIGRGEAVVAGTSAATSAINAAFANGIMAHADETDDSHPKSRTHPGCAIVPAALAMSEREGATGMNLIKAVVAGYDIGCRITQALGVQNLRNGSRSAHSIGGIFGATASAAAAAQLDETQARYALSYATQQASGIESWLRDDQHIEKAFVFGGMTARNGMTAALLAKMGFTGVQDPFSGEHNFFKAFVGESQPERLLDGLGSRYEIMFANIKKFPVGSPIQAPLEALLLLIKRHGLTRKDVHTIVAGLPDYGAAVVDNRSMPDVNLQYILAVTLLDGQLTFGAAHSYERMNEPEVLELRKRVSLVKDDELSSAKVMRQGIVEITTKDGNQFREHVVSVHGTAEDPMTLEEVEKKSEDLLTPVLGEVRSRELIHMIRNLENIDNIVKLRPLLSI
jgi:2-methylcitrate dehydratase PrpD